MSDFKLNQRLEAYIRSLNTIEETGVYWEFHTLVHKYLYYVLASPIYNDQLFDMIQKKADKYCSPNSPALGVGSDNPDHYPEHVKYFANKLLCKVLVGVGLDT